MRPRFGGNPGCSIRFASGGCTTASAPTTPTSIGSGASSCSMGSGIPRRWGAPEVEAFLTHLAVQGKVAASTQNQALNAIVFLYRHVLKQELGWLEGLERAKKPARLPVVFTRDEARAILTRLDGIGWVMASLLYGSGLWLTEPAKVGTVFSGSDAWLMGEYLR